MLCLALVAGVLSAGGGASAQAQDFDAQSSGARDLGDVTDWSQYQVFDDALDGVDDEVDYFKFSLSEPKLVGIGLRRLQLDADVFLEDSSGTVLASDRETGTTKEWISVGLNPGQYFLRVLAEATGTNTYRVRLGATEAPPGTTFIGAATIAGGADGSEADGSEADGSEADGSEGDGSEGGLRTLAQAVDDSTREGAQDLGDLTDLGALGPVRAGQWDGAVHGTDDAVDYFAFSLSESKLVGAGLRSMNRDADIFVEDASGTVLASSRRISNEQEWLNVTLAAGSYFIRVEAQDPYRTRYTLTMGTAGSDSVAAGFDTTATVGVGSELEERIAPYWDIDWVRVGLVADRVYVLEVRGQDSQSGTLVDPELRAVYVDPADASVFDAYGAVDRVASDGQICDSGMSAEALAEFPDPPDVALDSTDGINAFDFDDGVGQDAWLLIRAEATGSHYIKIDSQGGFAGSYTVAATDAGTFTPGADERGTCPRHFVLDRQSLTVDEGDSGSFELSLATRPSHAVSVTVSSGDTAAVSVPSQALVFTTGDWSTPQSVTVEGVQDGDTSDESVTVTLTASSLDSNYEGQTSSVSVTVFDDDAVGLVVDPDSLTVDEGDSGSFEVSLATQPSASVSVAVSSGDVGAVSVPAEVLVFTTGDWSTPQSVTVEGVQDGDTSDESVTVTLTASSLDSNYEGQTSSVSVSVFDDDAVGLVVDPDSLTVDEGDSGSFEVSLATQPSASVSVMVSSGDAGAVSVSVPSQALVFTTGDWSTPQSVTVEGVQDGDTSDESVTVTVTALSSDSNYEGETASVTVSVTDDGVQELNDAAALVVTPDALSIPEDGSGSFEVSLATQPSAAVSVAVSSGDAGAVSVPSQALVFTTGDWSTAQSVTVEGVQDADTSDESVTVTVTALSSDSNYEGETASVTVSVTDDGVQELNDAAALVVTPDALSIPEDGSGSFEVSLATQPSAAVSVTVSSGDAGAVSVPSQPLVFTTGDWSTAQSVTVEGVQDADTSDESVTVTVTATSDDADVGAATIAGGSEGGLRTLAQAVDDSTREGAQDLGDLTDLGALGPVRAGQWDGAVHGTDDAVDYFAFSLSESKLVGAGLRSMNRDADIFVEDASGTVLASSRRISNEQEWLNVTLAAGSYFIRVEAQDPYRTRYTLTMGTAGSDSVAAGFDTTATVGVGSELEERIAPYWDIDWVRVGLVADRVYVLEVRGQDSQSGTLVDPELRAVYVDPADASVFDAYGAVDRVASDGQICDSGMSAEALAEFPDPPDVALDSTDGINAFDFDDGVGQDAWLLIRAEATGSHYIKIDSQGGFAGSYTVAATDAGTFTPDADERGTCPVAATAKAKATSDDADYDGETAEVAVTVRDNGTAETVELVVDPEALTISENGSGSFEVSLATQPSATVSVSVSSGNPDAVSVPSTTLTFTTGNWSTAQQVWVGGVDDDDASSESVTVTVTALGGDYSGETATVAVTVNDDDTEALVADPGSLQIAENGSGSFEVKLATRPSGQVSVTVSSGDTAAVSVPSQALVFTPGDWSTPQSVNVEGVQDADTSDESLTVTLTASSSDSNYEGQTSSVSVSVLDDDAVGLVVDPDALSIPEDGSGSFEVSLATQPSATVSVTVSSGDAGAVSVPSQALVFTTGDWSTPQSVNVEGVQDADTSDESLTVTLTASSSDSNYEGQTSSVSVSVLDDDAVGLVVDPDSLTVDEGDSGSFEVSLATQPSATVSVTVSSGDAGAVSVPSTTLTFTTGNWSTAQQVWVGGVDDDDASSESVTVTVTALGGDYVGETAEVDVTVNDDDTEALVTDPGSLTVLENGSGSFTVKLATRPSGQVSVTVSSGDSAAVSVPSQALVFTTGDWSVAQSVSVGGVDDADALDESVTVTLTATGGDYTNETATVSVSVTDDDTAALVADPGSLQIAEGGSGSFTVKLATRPSGQVSVTVSSGDSAAVSVPSQALVFTTGDWSVAQSVTVGGVDDADALDESVSVTLTATGGDYTNETATVSVSVTDDDTAALVADPGSLQIAEGGSGSFDGEVGDAALGSGVGDGVLWRHRGGVGAVAGADVHDGRLVGGAVGDSGWCRRRRRTG